MKSRIYKLRGRGLAWFRFIAGRNAVARNVVATFVVALFVLEAFGGSGAQSTSSTQVQVLAFMGDSLTEGLGVAPEKAYPAIVERMFMARHIQVKAINAGVSGATSANGPIRLKWVLKSKPHWLILALGANDGLRGLSTKQMKKNLEQVISQAHAAGVRVLLAGMKVPPNFGPRYAKEFEVVYQDLAKANSRVVFVPFLLEKVGGEREMNQADGIHPNEKGHEVMADLIFKALRPHIEK